jgi:hypothetical protein
MNAKDYDCSTCAFFHTSPIDDEGTLNMFGQCRRNAPVGTGLGATLVLLAERAGLSVSIGDINDARLHGWPEVYADNWCGSWHGRGVE